MIALPVCHRAWFAVALCFVLRALAPSLPAQVLAAETPVPTLAEPAAVDLNPRGGKITLESGLADLSLPEGFRYLDKADARKVLVEVWRNPPQAADDQLGMIVPAGFNPAGQEAWGVIISYEDSGYVKDNDANKINYDDLLKQMQKGAQEHNPERVKAGYPAIEIVGWAAPPRYDAAAKKMYWAKQLRFGNEQGHDTLNYDVRILGRRGVLVLRAIAGMEQLDEIRNATPQILAMVNYNQGHRYADFNPKTDKVAAFGLAALVVGGIAAKAGFFKLLIPVLLAAKKFVIIGVVAVAGFCKRLFKGGEKTS